MQIITTTVIKDYLQDNATVHDTGTAYGCFNEKVLSEPQSEQLIHIPHVHKQNKVIRMCFL
jgi:hypothetical protein